MSDLVCYPIRIEGVWAAFSFAKKVCISVRAVASSLDKSKRHGQGYRPFWFTEDSTVRNVNDRFWEKVSKGDGCWLWMGTLGRNGYGAFYYHGMRTSAHRVVWELTYGQVPDGMCVCHHCDNRRCVRPDHLFLGTMKDNARDKSAKGRAPHGDTHWSHTHPEKMARGERNGASTHPERNPMRLYPERHPLRHHPELAPAARLSWDDVKAIREQWQREHCTYLAIARQYGVAEMTINDIIIERTWKPAYAPKDYNDK